MTVLQALAILESATLECQQREVDTPEARDALNILDPYVLPAWLIPQFRCHLDREPNPEDKQGQQRVLRVTFSGIRESVKFLLEGRMDVLARKFYETHDSQVREEMYDLAADLAKLDERGRNS